ncbi:MAG TPA: hypothetical protein VEI53_02535 [Ktedonobacteraceae bacterium]|nr:hypothetical protein [Ktedonobacteraceae bacterium]
MATIKELLSREAIRNTDRLEFLSDGVYAIALTILALGINVVSVVFYASCLAIAQGLEAALWMYATRVRKYKLIEEEINPHLVRYHTILFLAAAVIFLLSIGLAFIAPVVAVVSWVLLALVQEVIGGILRRRWTRKEGKVAPGN